MERYVVDDMRASDLAAIGWSGSPLHIEHVGNELERARRGEADYLVVRDQSGRPVAKGGVDYSIIPGTGHIWQVATRPDLEGRGLATRLVHELEGRILRRGVEAASLAVEPDNERALRLYRHLGYVEVGEREVSWPAERPDGSRYTHVTTVIDMTRDLSTPRSPP